MSSDYYSRENVAKRRREEELRLKKLADQKKLKVQQEKKAKAKKKAREKKKAKDAEQKKWMEENEASAETMLPGVETEEIEAREADFGHSHQNAPRLNRGFSWGTGGASLGSKYTKDKKAGAPKGSSASKPAGKARSKEVTGRDSGGVGSPANNTPRLKRPF